MAIVDLTKLPVINSIEQRKQQIREELEEKTSNELETILNQESEAILYICNDCSTCSNYSPEETCLWTERLGVIEEIIHRREQAVIRAEARGYDFD